MSDEAKTERPPGRRRARYVAIVGAAFSSKALACRLLRDTRFRGRVALIERTGTFGPGLAYGNPGPEAVLNVPAGNMSLDERRPTDFSDYLRSQGHGDPAHEFMSRRVYGRYLTERLDETAPTGDPRRRATVPR